MSDIATNAVPSPLHPTRIGKIAFALVIGTAGGLLFRYLTMPLPWMLGAMIATSIAAMMGLPLERSKRMRVIVITVLGVMLGSAFKPEILSQATNWIGSITGLLIWVTLITGTVYFIFVRWVKFDKPTAYFSAAPGGFGEMVLLGTALGGDERSISLVHTMRLMLTVMGIALWFRLFQGYVPGTGNTMAPIADLDPVQGALMVGAAALGFWGGRKLKVPAGEILGPLVISAALTLIGVADAPPPREAVNLAQLVLGTTIGCRFVGVPIAKVFKTLMIGAGATLLMLSAAILGAFGMEWLIALPFPVLLLAFAPGGLAEMCLISLALGIDIAFVSTHHTIRLIFLILCLPLVFRYLKD